MYRLINLSCRLKEMWLMGIAEKYVDIDSSIEREMFGQLDSFAKIIERALEVTIINRDGKIKLVGDSGHVDKAYKVIMNIAELIRRGNEITEQNITYAISLVYDDEEEEIIKLDNDLICNTINGKPVKPKTKGQKEYVDNIRNNMITFGVGPAGTGKTYLAMAMAITAFKKDEVNRIILTRPAIEAGEKLGFLPGDLQSKVDPYLRPLYDALNQIMGPESFIKNSEKGLIEVAPLAYMRGRTLDNSFIILDEAQNTTPAQMKMFLTRVGFGSKVVVTGDLTQKDLPITASSGLENALKILKKVEGIGFSYLTNKDVVRHPLVQRIVKAYDDYDLKEERKRQMKKERHEKRRYV